MKKSVLGLATLFILLVAIITPAITGCSKEKPITTAETANMTLAQPPDSAPKPVTSIIAPPLSVEASTLPAPADVPTNTATASDTSEPDLLIEDIAWSPLDPSPGDAVTFTVTIANQGSAESTPSRVSYTVNDSLMGDSSVTPIPGGGKVTRQFTWRVESLNYRVKITADADDDVRESNETNNASEVTLSEAYFADLTVDNITWSPPDPSPGDTMTFTVTITNQGSAESAPSRLNYYVDGSLMGGNPVSRIPAGDTVTSVFTWSAESGSHTVKAVADDEEAITETNESNNSREVTLSGISHTDLIIKSITWSPLAPAPGELVTTTVTIKNQGDRQAESSMTYCYLDGGHFKSIMVPRIAAGGTATVSFTWTASRGNHHISARADYYNGVTESNEDNNDAFATISGVSFADLAVDKITWAPQNPSQGELVTITATIKNVSGRDAGASLVYYYVDGAKIGSSSVSAVPAGGTATTVLTWRAELGEHTIRVVADPTALVPEIEETNNAGEVTFSGTRPVDLVIDDISWSPLNPLLYETLTFTVTVKNQGSGQAEASEVYYDINGASQGSGTLPAIPAGGTANVTFTWRAETGSHVIKAIADSSNALPESDETNNERQVNFSGTVIPKPDLVIRTTVFSPLEPTAGETVNFTVTLKNQGTSHAPPTWLHFKVDGSQVKATRTFIIPAGDTWTETFTWNAQTGEHHIEFIADATQNLLEIDEGNNIARFTLVVK